MFSSNHDKDVSFGTQPDGSDATVFWFSHQISWQNWIPHDPTERYGLGLDIWLSHSHQKRPHWDDEVSGPEIHWLTTIVLT